MNNNKNMVANKEPCHHSKSTTIPPTAATTMPFAKAHATAANVDESSRSAQALGLTFTNRVVTGQ
jgi:hypothetical protein